MISFFLVQATRVTPLALVFMGMLAVDASQVNAHAFAPSLLEIQELSADGHTSIRWKQPAKKLVGTELRPIFSQDCDALETVDSYHEGTGIVVEWETECSGGWIGQSVRVDGLKKSRSSVVFRIVFSDGRTFQTLLNASESSVLIPARESELQIARSYLGLGVEHIIGGVDHLVFVLCLVILVGRGKRLLWTVTAFTLGHSLTLALAILEWIVLPQAIVEAAIAFSIYILAIEIIRKQQGKTTTLDRAPWLVAALFGLLHGLGFAGALAEIGLPESEIPMALFSFNVGIEIGQLLFVALVLAIWGILMRLPLVWPKPVTYFPAYAIGGVAGFWLIDRSSLILGI